MRYGHIMSNMFSLSKGVKHGGVLSPIDSVYADGLLKRIQETIVGFHMGHLLFV